MVFKTTKLRTIFFILLLIKTLCFFHRIREGLAPGYYGKSKCFVTLIVATP